MSKQPCDQEGEDNENYWANLTNYWETHSGWESYKLYKNLSC